MRAGEKRTTWRHPCWGSRGPVEQNVSNVDSASAIPPNNVVLSSFSLSRHGGIPDGWSGRLKFSRQMVSPSTQCIMLSRWCLVWGRFACKGWEDWLDLAQPSRQEGVRGMDCTIAAFHRARFQRPPATTHDSIPQQRARVCVVMRR